MAKRPPSSCTIGRSSGGMTGMASRTIHSGRFSDLMNAFTTLSRLIARCCFWPLDVRMVSRSDSASASRSRSRSRSRIASAPIPPWKYTPKPYEEPNRSLSSRNSCSSLMICFGSSALNVSQVCASRLRDSSAASRVSARRASMSWYISRTFSAHWMIASWSSFCVRPSALQAEVVRQLAHLVRVRGRVGLAPASRPAARFRARATSRGSSGRRRETSSASSSFSSSPASSAATMRLTCLVSAPFFEPVAPSSSW